MLEMNRIIEHAFLPDKCEILDVNNKTISLRISGNTQPLRVVVRSDIPIEKVCSMRALSRLVLAVRDELNGASYFEEEASRTGHRRN